MSQNSRTQRPARSHVSLRSTLSLALGQMRQAGLLMGITTIGMLAAIVIVCVVPLFTSVVNTAGLRSMLASSAENANIEVNTTTLGLSTKVRNEVQGEFAGFLRQNMGTTGQWLHPAQSAIISSSFSFASEPRGQARSLTLYGAEMAQASSHLGKLHGQIPAPTTTIQRMDILISTKAAKALLLKIGDDVPLVFAYLPGMSTSNSANLPAEVSLPLTVHISGTFDGDPQQAGYWHNSDFDPLIELEGNQVTSIAVSMLIPNESLLFLADQLAAQNKSDAIFVDNDNFTLRWDYRLDFSQISIADLDTMIADINTLQTAYQASYSSTDSVSLLDQPAFPYLSTTKLTSPLFSQGETIGVLDQFRQRVDVSRVSATVLTLQVVLLVLFFVSLMTTLLVDRQTETLALMRSRGASRGQVFAMLLMQCLLLGLLALALGIPLALTVVALLTWRNLAGASQDALNSVTAHLPQVVQSSALYGLGILLVILLTMGLQLFQTTRLDVLALRRQSARSNRRSLWQRFNLDIIAGLLALLSYGISLYLTSVNSVLQGDARTLIVAPLSILAPLFLLIGGLLLFMRLFPLLLRLASWLAARGKGAVPMLALAQIARAPRQPLRMTLLLTLATAFTFFTLIYSASETYHIQQISIYLTGADFSGNTNALGFAQDPAKFEQPFQQIHGVLSTSTGYATSAYAGKGRIPIEFRAVDATTFAPTVIWPSSEEQTAGNALLTRLVSLRQTISTQVAVQPIPAIIDTVTASKLLLHVGSLFPVNLQTQNAQTLHYQVAGIVPSIPTVNNRLVTGVAGTPIPGAVLVDYRTFGTIYSRVARIEKQQDPLTRNNPNYSTNPPALSTVWLHTRGDAASLASVRQAITQPATHLFRVADRWQTVANLTGDPLYLVLGGVLGIGTVTALLLALMGDLLASWLSARTRLLSFAIVRALGSTPGEVAGVLVWEQIIIYASGLLLGTGAGWVLASSSIPALTFTDLNTNVNTNQFYALQTAFPIQVVLPPGLLFGLLGLGVLFLLALALSVRVVSRPLLSQVLRLSED